MDEPQRFPVDVARARTPTIPPFIPLVWSLPFHMITTFWLRKLSFYSTIFKGYFPHIEKQWNKLQQNKIKGTTFRSNSYPFLQTHIYKRRNSNSAQIVLIQQKTNNSVSLLTPLCLRKEWPRSLKCKQSNNYSSSKHVLHHLHTLPHINITITSITHKKGVGNFTSAICFTFFFVTTVCLGCTYVRCLFKFTQFFRKTQHFAICVHLVWFWSI